MILYYPIKNRDDIEYDCSGTEPAYNGIKNANFPTTPYDSLSVNTDRTSVPVAVYHVSSKNSLITIEPNSAFTLPNEFTISFWVYKKKPMSGKEYIFRSTSLGAPIDDFSIYVDTNMNLKVEYGALVSRSLLLQSEKWTFVSVRLGEMEISGNSFKALLLETTTVPVIGTVGSAVIPSKTSSTYGGTTTPVSAVSFTNKKWTLLDNLEGIVSEFRVWDKVLTSEELKNVSTSPILIKTGTEENPHSEFNVEDIREVQTTGYDNNREYIHSKSVSTLSSHMENILDDSFPLFVKNEFFGLNSEENKETASRNTYPNGTLVNTSYATSPKPYTYQEILEEGKTYFVRCSVRVSSDECNKIVVFTDEFTDEPEIEKINPTANINLEISGLVKGGADGKLSIGHIYDTQEKGRELTVSEVLVVDLTTTGIEKFLDDLGIIDWADKENWANNTFKDLHPNNTSGYKNIQNGEDTQIEEEVSITLYPETATHSVSRRRNYTIENIATDKFTTEKTKTGGTSLILEAITKDLADVLLYASIQIKNTDSSSIVVKLVAKSGTTILGDSTPGWTHQETIPANTTKTLSILVKEGWAKGSQVKNISSIEVISSSNFSYGEFILCDLTNNGIEYWLDANNYYTATTSSYVNTLEKKSLWCDKFLTFDKFTSDKASYNMVSPYYLTTTEVAKIGATTDKVGYYDAMDKMTEDDGNTDIILKEDVPNFSLFHSFGNSTDPFGTTPLKGVGVFANTIKEIKDI